MHRFILEPYKSQSSRHRCPGCSKNRTFALYIDTETNEPVNDRVGRCNREVECGYHYAPGQYFKDNGVELGHVHYVAPVPRPQPPTSYVDPQIFKKSLAAYGVNHLVKFFRTIFDENTVTRLIAKYFVGTSSHWLGATVFWQLDYESRIRTGKVMLYNPETGKRVKEPFSHLTWSHKVLKLENFNHKLCLFGEHLLKADPAKPVAIVESEKTAMISSVYMPQYIWLAVGGLSQLTADRCSVLKGRSVMLYPDLNAYDKWKIKGDEFGFKTSSVLESKATEEEKKQGLDIADYLLRVNVKQMSPQTAGLSHVKTKYDQSIECIGLKSSEVSSQNAAATVHPNVIKLQQEFEQWDLSGRIVPEAATIDKIGFIADLSDFVGHLWRQVVKRQDQKQYLFAVESLRIIADYYNRNPEHHGLEQGA
jgi:hypothetical protein